MHFARMFIHSFIILSVISATISPACAFISGQNKTWIEICSGLGQKIVPIDEQRETAPDMTSQSCAFCFHGTDLHGLIPENTALPTSVWAALHRSFVNEFALIQAVKTTQARAPPFSS